MEEPGGEDHSRLYVQEGRLFAQSSPPASPCCRFLCLFAVVSVLRCFTFGSWPRSTSHFTWIFFVVVVAAKPCVPPPSVSCRYGWLSLCGLRSTNPGLVPHQGAPGHLAQRLPPVSGRDYLPVMELRCAVTSSGFEWVECVVSSPTWVQLSWQHASLNSLRSQKLLSCGPNTGLRSGVACFCCRYFFVFCTKRTARLYFLLAHRHRQGPGFLHVSVKWSHRPPGLWPGCVPLLWRGRKV